MLFGFNLNQLFIFPFQGNEARKHFLIGCLIYLAGFFIPVLPWLIATGYNAILIRQVLSGQKPHLVPWENWDGLLKDGARLFGVRLVYVSPLLALLLIFFLASFAFPFLAALGQNSDTQIAGIATLIFMLGTMGLFFLIMPLSLAAGLIVPAAEIHVVAKDAFVAGFQVKDWWPIFKKDWGGFLVALAILYALSMVMSMAMQFLLFTIVLACLFPLFLPVISMYAAVVQYVAFAQAYKEGKDQLYREAPAT